MYKTYLDDGVDTGKGLFESLYVGGLDKAMHLMQENFPELGFKREDCAEMTWMTLAFVTYTKPNM